MVLHIAIARDSQKSCINLHVEKNVDSQVLGQCLLMLSQYPYTYYNVAQFCSSCLLIVKTTLEIDQVSNYL